MRVSLQSFQRYVQANFMGQNEITLAQLQYACDSLNRLYQACHWRKIEMYLIPAIRQATERADHLLDELSALNNSALEIVTAVQEQVGNMTLRSERHVTQVCADIDNFCSALLKRLEKEERELFAVARSVICGEAWFSIANQFLLHDARTQEARRGKAAAVIPLPLPPAPNSPADDGSAARRRRAEYAPHAAVGE